MAIITQSIDSMYNSYFTTPNTARNGTTYCYVGAGGSSSLSSSCSSTYNSTTARLDVNGRMYSFTPQGSGGSTKDVLLPSDIKQAYSLGTEAEFMWMELRLPSTTLTYTPPENNATGFTQGGANKNDSVTGGTLNAGSAVTRQTYANEVIIAGEVYKDEKMDAFLNDTKKVLAFAPIPIIHTNKYRMTQQPTGATDVRFKHAHTIMPHFISDAFMEDKDNGTDLRFDFHQLVDQDYAESGAHMVYGTNGSNSFATQNSFANSMGETNLDGMYAYTGDVLAQDGTLSTTRFNNGNANDYHTPKGQSLWQQVFNPNGRGAGIFVQMNWSCGDGGNVRCNEAYAAKDAGPHKTQQSLFSVLIAEVGSKTFFQDTKNYTPSTRHHYDGYGQGHVMRGEHYWSYKRRSGRTTSTDGAYATTDASPQLSFGLTPIACHSGTDNGCFFGDGQSPDSSTIGAPQVAVVSNSDSCIHGSLPGMGCAGNHHHPGVMHSMAESTTPTEPEWQIGSFNQGIVLQKQRDANDNLVEAINLEGATNSWRAGQTTTSDTWSGKMIGLLMTDVNDSTKNAIPRSFNVNDLTVTFDDRNDRVKFVGTDIDIEKDLGNECGTSIDCSTTNSVNHWYHAVSGQAGRDAGLKFSNTAASGTIQFGDADDSVDQPYDIDYQVDNCAYGGTNCPWTESAYLNKKVFGAMLKQGVSFRGGAECTSTDCPTYTETDPFNNGAETAGAIVTWDTIDKKDRDFMSDNATEPSLEYMSWGIWAKSHSDFEPTTGMQAAAVHMGTWFAGDLLDASDWPVARTASLAGMAMFDVFARIQDGGVTNSYHWTEGAAATGSVDFNANGSYDVSITVNNLGTENCPSSYCGSTFDQNMNKGPMGSITWSATQSATNKNPHFETAQSGGGFSRVSTRSVSGGPTVYEYKAMSGSLYGTANHVEVGAQLEFTRQNINEMIMLRGTAVLSE